LKSNKTIPPKSAQRFLNWFLRDDFAEEVEGDLDEQFHTKLENTSLFRAKLNYWYQVINYLRSFAISKSTSSQLIHYAMINHYFKISSRNLFKNKAHSLINIFGLGLGIACCFLIFIFVQDELSYDAYHEKGERIYRVMHGRKSADNSEEGAKANLFWVWGNAPIGPSLSNEFPEIDKVVQFSGRSDILLSNEDKVFQEDGIFFMDSTVFDVFSWKLLRGNPKTALIAPYSIVLTESTARKYFGDQDPLGLSLKGSESAGRSDAGDYSVTGVMADVPLNSHFRFNALLSMSTFKKSRPDIFNSWGYVDFYTYFLVNEQFNKTAFEMKIPTFISRTRSDPNSKYTIAIESLKDVYLRTDAQRQPGETGSLSNIYVFSIIGLFILVIAMINFMNLSTARSLERAKEVGIRKTVGAARRNLIFQFLGESMIIVFLSMIVSLIIFSLALPSMVAFTGKQFALQNMITWQLVPIFFGVLMGISLIAGAYPAMALSGFRPSVVLKGSAKLNMGGVNLRSGLVVFQFSLSIALIAGTIIVYSQMNKLMDKDLGFDNEHMMVLDYNYDEAVNDKSEVLKVAMEANHAILSAAFSRSVPGSYFPNAGTDIQTSDGEMKRIVQPIFQVGMDFITHFDLELLAGRSYSRDYPSDSSEALVINESVARQYGYTNPADIIGRKFSQWGREGEVIGVVKDFNYISLHRAIEPLTLPFDAYSSRYLSLKVKSENLSGTIQEIGQIWGQLAPHRPFLYSFLNDDFNRQYHSDFIFRKLFTTFSCLAIFIACLGLLGLATYTAEQRTKEVGIRKVLGANVYNIVTLLSKNFMLLVFVSIIIATPISWYVMNQWLNDFAYRIEVQPWIFVLAGLIALSIALFTVSYQAIKAALMNPTKSLRAE
jgi:putative ABC transport system permease protein